MVGQVVARVVGGGQHLDAEALEQRARPEVGSAQRARRSGRRSRRRWPRTAGRSPRRCRRARSPARTGSACRGRRPSGCTAPARPRGRRPASSAAPPAPRSSSGTPCGVQQPDDVVVGGDQQRGRVAERDVLGDPLRRHVPVRGDDRQVAHRGVEPTGDAAGRRARPGGAGPDGAATLHRSSPDGPPPGRGRAERLPEVAAVPSSPCQPVRRVAKVWPMTLIGEVPPGLGGARPPGSGTPRPSSTRTRSPAFVQRAARRPPVRRAQRLRAGARRAPGPARCRCCCGAVHGALHGRVSRLTVLIALGTHAPMGEEALAAHLGYAPGRLAATYPGHDRASTTSGGSPRRSPTSAPIPAARIVELSEGRMTWTCRCCSTGRSSSTTSRWCSARCCRTRSSGSPAATSTSSRASAARRSSTSRTGWAR